MGVSVSGIRHVVVFTWKAEATEEQRRAVPERLSALPGAIPEIAAYAFGGDVGLNQGNGDFAVVADFASREDYLVYRDHPEHRAAIAETIAPIVDGRTAVQFAL
ncbi:MAG: Dabb family protein [Streptosporangiales bacterium]|nr:Dabb family protein [Streptosporangiales bacterium]